MSLTTTHSPGIIAAYGVDWNAPAIIEDETATIEFPSTHVPLQQHELTVLQTEVNPLEECDDTEIKLCVITKQFVEFCFNN